MGLFSKFEQHHKKDPMQRVLDSLHGCLETKDEIRGETVFCPEWNVSIKPQIDQLDDHMAVLNFYISSPDWEEPLFECCAGMGSDTDTAIGMAMSSFLFSFMQGIAIMQREEDGLPLESEFNGNTHRWSVYKSNVAGMGENIDAKAMTSVYWELLKDHIAKRLGNQKMCYVKIYAAKAVGADGEQITGECRINDVPSSELGALVGEIAKNWDVKQFASQKQFFFIKQDPATLLPSPYGNENKFTVLRENVKTALELFNGVQTQEDYDSLPDKLFAALGDKTLAEECYSFLPEICAERAFGQMQFSEQVQFFVPNKPIVTVYKNQLADFYPLYTLMFTLFDSGYFGENTNNLYGLLVSLSSIYGAVQQAKEKGSNIENCKMTSLLFNTSPEFEIR